MLQKLKHQEVGSILPGPEKSNCVDVVPTESEIGSSGGNGGGSVNGSDLPVFVPEEGAGGSGSCSSGGQGIDSESWSGLPHSLTKESGSDSGSESESGSGSESESDDNQTEKKTATIEQQNQKIHMKRKRESSVEKKKKEKKEEKDEKYFNRFLATYGAEAIEARIKEKKRKETLSSSETEVEDENSQSPDHSNVSPNKGKSKTKGTKRKGNFCMESNMKRVPNTREGVSYPFAKKRCVTCFNHLVEKQGTVLNHITTGQCEFIAKNFKIGSEHSTMCPHKNCMQKFSSPNGTPDYPSLLMHIKNEHPKFQVACANCSEKIEYGKMWKHQLLHLSGCFQSGLYCNRNGCIVSKKYKTPDEFVHHILQKHSKKRLDYRMILNSVRIDDLSTKRYVTFLIQVAHANLEFTKAQWGLPLNP